MAWFTPSSSRRSHSSHHSYHSSSSYYRRRPRDGYVQRLIHQLRRILRHLVIYARRHPVKIFLMFVMPLLTGGALHGVLRRVGIKMPVGLAGGGRGGHKIFDDGYSSYSRRSGGAFGDFGGGAGSIQGLMKVVQAFM